MSDLTNSEFAVVQRFCQLLTEKIAGMGLDIYVEHDFQEFVRVRQALTPNYLLNPTYHPEYCKLTKQDSFWLRVVDSEGQTVATVAKRVLDSDCFHDDLVGLRLWHDADAPAPAVQSHGIDCESARALRGRIAHGGALWIASQYRKQNLSGLLADLCRGLVLRNIGYDHLTAFMSQELASTGIGTTRYGYPHVGGQMDVDFYHSGTITRLIFAHISKDETLEQMRAWLLFPSFNSLQALGKLREFDGDRADHQFVNAAAVAREWKDEAGVGPGQIVNARHNLVVDRHAA